LFFVLQKPIPPFPPFFSPLILNKLMIRYDFAFYWFVFSEQE
jgi:hypothetical protein